MKLTLPVFAAGVASVSGATLGAALLSQYWGGLRPCELCLLQRWPWAAAGALALVVLLAAPPRRMLPWLALALAAIFAIGAVLAFYHVGVEQHWFAGPSACTAAGGAPATASMSLDEMKRQILQTAPVLCDKVQWSLAGVSLAGFNLAASLAMTVLCGVVAASARPAAATALTA